MLASESQCYYQGMFKIIHIIPQSTICEKYLFTFLQYKDACIIHSWQWNKETTKTDYTKILSPLKDIFLI